jgi:phosphoribosylanthranilate isomerase
MWIKICGMTSADAVAAAQEAGADAIGFVFAPSVRRQTPARAAQLAANARGKLTLVAVCLHPSAQEWREIAAEFAPDVLQTDHQDYAALAGLLACGRLPVLRTGVQSPAALPERLVFEGAVSGTGQVTDWSQPRQLRDRTQLVLAGGLHAGNVAEAIRNVQPWGVDTSSGVERAPGIKEPRKIFEFVRAARIAAGEPHSAGS